MNLDPFDLLKVCLDQQSYRKKGYILQYNLFTFYFLDFSYEKVTGRFYSHSSYYSSTLCHKLAAQQSTWYHK